MNRFILALAAVASIALSLGSIAPVAAQNASGGFQGPQGAAARQQFAKMLLSRNRSEGEQTQIRAIMAAALAKSKTQSDFQAKGDTMRAANKSVEQVLTPPQLTKLHAERDA